MSLAGEVTRRGIREVVHFTTNRGFVGILAHGSVLSRKRLPQEKYLECVLYPNAAVRPEESASFDKAEDWLDYVNLSVSEINSRFFATSQRWHRDQDVWWVIMAFDPDILLHQGVVFATTNNKYQLCSRAAGAKGFAALFAPVTRRLPGWSVARGRRADLLPTCEQAEVLYPKKLATEYLRRVYVGEGQDRDRVRGWLREFNLDHVEVVIEPTKFQGAPN